MFSFYKLVPLEHIIFNVTRHTGCKIGKIGARTTFHVQKMHLLHILFNYPTIDINSQHPYLLGFNSNLIPNFNILVFQPYPGEDSEYSEESGRFTCNSASSSWEYPKYLGNSFLTGPISCRIQQCSLQNIEYIDYSLDSERKTQIIGKIIKRSSEMAKFAIPAQEISENLEKSL